MAEKYFEPIVFIDMDQVLTNFDKAVAELFGTTIKKLNTARQRDPVWCLLRPLTKAVGRGKKNPITLEEFWHRIHQEGQGFWEDMDPLPWVDDLIDHVQKFTPNWYIATTPSNDYCSYVGKLKWIDKHIGIDHQRVLLTQHKHLFAKPETILIDDRTKNVDDFERAGGRALLFPSHGNVLSTRIDDPLLYIKELSYLFINPPIRR